MKKPKSINASVLSLTSLFVLSQTVLAISAVSDTKDKNLLAQYKPYEYITADQRAQIIVPDSAIEITDSVLTLMAAAETSQTTVQTANPATENQISALAAATPAPTASTTPQPKQEIKGVVRYVNANSLNVRSEPNSESKLVSTISRGDKVTYYETIGEWARIITWTDKKGYVLAKYLVNSEKDVAKPAAQTTSRSTSTSNAGAQPASAEAQSLTEKILAYAKSLQGVKYVYGGYSTKGFDCSGFTKYVFAKFGINLPRSSSEYMNAGTKVDRTNLRAGDIVLWDINGGTPNVGHVGIYLGDGTFIHASSTKGKVVIANLNTYREKYMGARRFIK